MDDIRQKGEEIAKAPLSDWDLKIYVQQEYGVSWEPSPFSLIESIIKIVRFKRFAAEFWNLLTPEERAELHNRAQAWITEIASGCPVRSPPLNPS